MSRVVVIGAGLAGLASACHLVGAGHDVTVVEREPIVGGRAGRLELDGFSFDTGPTVMTMPELVAEALDAVGAEL
ncbi:MAG TPA: FAD-dependent oxidoreductase, partial [Microlunatus sp.]|nr:FAD-dependent oxidoreductase [Microlunatus sp.]